jgi:hypothetical protein
MTQVVICDVRLVRNVITLLLLIWRRAHYWSARRIRELITTDTPHHQLPIDACAGCFQDCFQIYLRSFSIICQCVSYHHNMIPPWASSPTTLRACKVVPPGTHPVQHTPGASSTAAAK